MKYHDDYNEQDEISCSITIGVYALAKKKQIN